MTNDLISREAAIHAVNAYDYCGFTVEEVKIITDGCVEELHKLPSIEAELVRHGRWISSPVIIWEPYQCSICEKYSNVTHKYCPNCGAKMDLEW